MKNTLSISVLILCFYSLASCYKEKVTYAPAPNKSLELPLLLRLNHKDCFLEHRYHTLRYSLEPQALASFRPYVQFQDNSTVTFEGKTLQNNAFNDLGNIVYKQPYQVQISREGSEPYQVTLTFTNLPIVRVVTKKEIVDEPKKVAKITVNYPTIHSLPVTSYIGIEHRGGSALQFDKKSYGFEFLSRADVGSEKSKSLFDLPAQEDWILDAMHIDKAKSRNQTSFELWHQIAGHRENCYSIATHAVELFLNDEQQGLYSLNQHMSPEKLALTHPGGVLYKAYTWQGGGPTFDQLHAQQVPYNTPIWDGWEQKYPDEEILINWQPLFDFRHLVVHGSDSLFNSEIAQHVQLDYLMDYYILMNTIYAQDNTGKNILWVKPTPQEPFIIIPWDMDATWGRSWEALPTAPTALLSNQLFNRLIRLNSDNFKTKLKARWQELRQTTCSPTNLISLFDRPLNSLLLSDIATIENFSWNQQYNFELEKQVTADWIRTRILFLDTYFDGL